MKVFITGATGFVGGHVARAYAAEGAKLRLLTRASSNQAGLEGLAADVIVGDLRQPEGLRSAIAGCDAVVHVAADYRLWVTDPDAMYAANVQGTSALLQLAREAGVPRVVYTSSVATMSFRTDGTIVDEASPVAEADMIGHYKRSKYLAEQEAIKAAAAGQHVMILNPTTPIGSADAKPTPTGRIVVDFLNGNFPAYVETGLNLVDVLEVARMHVAALEQGRPGERYILGGENLTLKQILDRLAAITGLGSPTVKVPHGVALGFAYFDEYFNGRLRGKEPRATVEAVQMGRKMMFACSAKAERELSFKVVPVGAALKASVDWFLAQGYAPVTQTACAQTACTQTEGAGLVPAVAIIGALPREVAGLVRGVKPDAALRREGVFLYRLRDAVVVCAGMGMLRATSAVRAALAQGGIQTLISAGLAGGCDPALAVGSVVAVGTVVDILNGVRYGDAATGAVLVTTDAIAGVNEKQRLFASYGAAVVDMEAATVARLAQTNGLAFHAFKAVSDAHDFELSTLSRFTSAHGHFRTRAFALHTALRPHRWRQTMQLGAGSQKALRNLTATLKELLG